MAQQAIYETSINYPLYKKVLDAQMNFAKTSYIDLTKFNQFAEENQLHYTAVGGSILGLFRHGGIIPWDADVDIGLIESEFNKLQSLKTPLRIRIIKRHKRYRYGTLDIVLLEDKGDWYEGENDTFCHKEEYGTLKKQAFGKTSIYAPTNSTKTLFRKYGDNYADMGRVKGQELFKLTTEDRTYL